VWAEGVADPLRGRRRITRQPEVLEDPLASVVIQPLEHPGPLAHGVHGHEVVDQEVEQCEPCGDSAVNDPASAASRQHVDLLKGPLRGKRIIARKKRVP